MAAPTYAQTWDAIRKATWVVHQDYLELTTNTEKFLDHETDLKAAAELLDSPLASSVFSALGSYRSSRAAIVVGGRALIDPALEQMGRVIDVPERDPISVLDRLRQYMVDQSPDDTLKNISGSFGTPSAVTGTGSGGMLRLTVGKDGYALEGGYFTETRTFEVTEDAQVGTDPGSEGWTFRGDNAGPDVLEEDGSGMLGSVTTDSDNTSLLQNSSFGDLDGASITSLTSIPGWTVDTAIANFNLDETTTHRKSSIESTARSLLIKATDGIKQKLSVQGISISDPDNQPYIFWIWWNRNGSTGTLTISMGTVTESVTVSAQTGWQLLYIGLSGGINKNLYYPNWQEDDADLAISWTHSSGSGILVDGAFFGPMRQIGPTGQHTWASLYAGATNFLRDDKITVVDRIDNTGIIQQWLRRLYGFTLPHAASGSETIVDPT